MEIFLNLWQNWSNYEKVSTLVMFSLLLIIFPLLIKLITNSRQLLFFSTISLVSSAILAIIFIWFLNIIFSITITYIFLLIPIILLFINTLSIGTSVGYYTLHNKSKNFSMGDLKKEYVKDSIQLSIFILLLFSAFSVFLSSTFFIFILITAILSLAVIWTNYIILLKLIK